MEKNISPLNMIAELIELPSISSTLPHLDSSNETVIQRLSDWLEADDFQVEIMPVAKSPAKFNLIATKGRGTGGLVLAGHTDTVPCDLDLWQQNPFKLTEQNGLLYGLGSSDMKSFLALAVAAASTFTSKQLKQPLIILATADEESSMAGAKALVAAGKPRARSAIIGEPTDGYPVRTHKGVMMLRIRVDGQSGHSSNPAYGNSALEGMHQIITELLTLRTRLQERYHNPFFAVPGPTLNLGHIHGGDNPNRICGQCILDIDLRPLPGMQLNELHDTIHQHLQKRLQDTGLQVSVEKLFAGNPPMETPADAKIVKMAESLTGQTAQSVSFSTEAPYLQELGMEVVVCGPGGIAQAHQPDEYLRADSVTPSIELLTQLIHQHCVLPDSQ